MILRWYFSLHFQRSLILDKVLCIRDISLILYRKMRLWYFFEEKDLYVRIFVGSLSLAYFLLNIIIASSLLLEESCAADTPPFYYNSPSHNFFRNFLAKSFVVSNNICTFVTTPRFPLEQRAQGESFWFFLPCSAFSYSINAEEDSSDMYNTVINHITSDKQWPER